jgi:hypothetical protein
MKSAPGTFELMIREDTETDRQEYCVVWFRTPNAEPRTVSIGRGYVGSLAELRKFRSGERVPATWRD